MTKSAASAQFVRASVAALLSTSVLAGFATQLSAAEAAGEDKEVIEQLTEVQVTCQPNMAGDNQAGFGGGGLQLR